MKPLNVPIYDAAAPIACTIGADEVAPRLALIERLREQLGRIERTDHGMMLHFPISAAVEADVRRFAADEKQCCQFWGFAVDAAEHELTLRWDAPPAADEIVDQLYAYFEGDAPITTISGLL
jgi:hypothetical protein